MLSDLYYGTLLSSGVTALARRLRHGALVLCYHNVTPDRASLFGDPALHLPVDQFETQLQWLRDHYTVVRLRDIVDRLTSGRSVRGLAAITFDDGYLGSFTYAWPLLRALGLPATMFVVGGAPSRPAVFWWDHPAIRDRENHGARERRLHALRGDRELVLADAVADSVAPPSLSFPPTHLPADWSVVIESATAGLDIGGHTLTHRTLTRLDDAELAREVAAAGEIIREHTGEDPAFFSYPYGAWDTRVRDAVRRAGYRAAVTLDYGLNGPGTDPYALRRINVPASISPPAFKGWTAGIRPRSASAPEARPSPTSDPRPL